MQTQSTQHQLRLNDWRRISEGDAWLDWSVADWLDRCIASQDRFIALASGHPAARSQHNVDGWTAVKLFEELAFYGRYGAMLRPIPVAERQGWIDTTIATARLILEQAPRDCADDNAARIFTLALGRKVLDEGKGVLTPAALGLLGELSEGRVRNLMSGAQAQLTSVHGGVATEQALAWLGTRSAFWPSIWQEDETKLPDGEIVMVPQASDGSVFHPGLRRRNGFTIGAKGAEATVEAFDAALTELARMDEPRWRRPNGQGNWGIVKASGWVSLPRSQLDLIR